MIEQALRFGARLRPAAKANTFFDRTVDELLLGSFRVDEFERFIGDIAVDLLQFQIALQPTTAYRPVFDFRRRITKGKPLVVEISILTQSRDHCFNDRFVPFNTLPLKQSFAQLRDGARFRGQKLDRALECFAANFV